MDRIKRRIALCLAASAMVSVFTATPAAADSCHPYPEAVCNTHRWYYECVFYIIWYGQAADHCDS